MLRRMHVLVVIVVAAVAGVAGCGNDTSSPAAPEDAVAPAPVTDLTAHVDATRNPCVSLSWSPGSEPDLVGYRVYRTESRDATGSTKRGSARISMVVLDELADTTFVDAAVTAGMTYGYAVTAVDNSGNESARALTTVLVVPPPVRGPMESIN